MGVVFNHLPAVNALDMAYWVTVFLLSAPVHCIHCRGAVWGQLDLPYSGLGTCCQQAAALQLWPSPGKASGMKVDVDTSHDCRSCQRSWAQSSMQPWIGPLLRVLLQLLHLPAWHRHIKQHEQGGRG